MYGMETGKDMPVFMYIFLINRGYRRSEMDREREK